MSDPTDNENEMHRRVDWLKPSDRSILAGLADFDGWMKPASISLNVPYTRRHIARRCQVLADHGLLERHEDTAGYRLTDLGRQFLKDKLKPEDIDAEDLEDDA